MTSAFSLPSQQQQQFVFNDFKSVAIKLQFIILSENNRFKIVAHFPTNPGDNVISARPPHNICI